jgi:hypothetical protein
VRWEHIFGHFLTSLISPAARIPFKSKTYKQTPLAQKMLIHLTKNHFWRSERSLQRKGLNGNSKDMGEGLNA